MEKKTKKKSSAIPIVSIILSAIAIILCLAIIAGAILKPIIEFASVIFIWLAIASMVVLVVVISYINDPYGVIYLTSPIEYGGCQIVGLNDVFSSELTVPSEIDGEAVVSIGESVFAYTETVTKVVISEGVRNIEAGAFQYCTNLEEIVLPDSLEYIGDGAFMGCESLKSVKIGKNTRFIGNNAFQDCTALETVELSNGVEEIGKQAFYNCSSLRAITIPQNVFKIGMGAFFGCDSMTTAIIYGSYNVGEGTVSVGDYPNLQDMADALTGIYSQYDWEKD